MKDKERAGSNIPQELHELPKLAEHADKPAAKGGAGLAAGSFSTYFMWRGTGVVQSMRFNHGLVNANSRVFVSISEYITDATANRFIGSARMNVYNVAPFDGGFYAWVEVSWNAPLNVRFDVLVDP